MAELRFDSLRFLPSILASIVFISPSFDYISSYSCIPNTLYHSSVSIKRCLRFPEQIEGKSEQEKAFAMRMRGDAIADQEQGGAGRTLSVECSVDRDNVVGVGD